MTQIVQWIGSNGEVLLPLATTSDNSAPMVSSNGNYFMPIFYTAPPTIEAGNPIGLLLSLTYSGTP